MARRKQTKGKCAYCGREMAKSGMTRHLKTCPARREAVAAADAGRGKTQTIYHLQVQNAWNPDFWLHLEMNGEATLRDLDSYLRAIWLECCGHLSAFYQGEAWRGYEPPMTTKASRIFALGVKLIHLYDFGSTTETAVNVIAIRQGKPLTKHPIALMSRNNMPEVACMECGEPATYICMECLYEGEGPCELCDEHAETHPHDDYGPPMPLVNSPRVGVCGYEGPAEPPY